MRRDGEVVACGLLKLEGDHAGLFVVTTAPAWRGRGLARSGGRRAARRGAPAGCGNRLPAGHRRQRAGPRLVPALRLRPVARVLVSCPRRASSASPRGRLHCASTTTSTPWPPRSAQRRCSAGCASPPPSPAPAAWLPRPSPPWRGAPSGSSRGFVTYSNAAKVEDLAVPAATLARFGAVSEQTALAMAQGALRGGSAQWAVGGDRHRRSGRRNARQAGGHGMLRVGGTERGAKRCGPSLEGDRAGVRRARSALPCGSRLGARPSTP